MFSALQTRLMKETCLEKLNFLHQKLETLYTVLRFTQVECFLQCGVLFQNGLLHLCHKKENKLLTPLIPVMVRVSLKMYKYKAFGMAADGVNIYG